MPRTLPTTDFISVNCAAGFSATFRELDSTTIGVAAASALEGAVPTGGETPMDFGSGTMIGLGGRVGSPVRPGVDD